MQGEEVFQSTPSDVIERWKMIEDARANIIEQLEELTSEIPGDNRTQLTAIGDWFRSKQGLRDALQRPDVLAICMSLLTNAPEEATGYSQGQITRSIRIGISRLGPTTSPSRQLFRSLIYPAVVFLFGYLLFTFFSLFIAPQFAEVFDGFGIQLPGITQLVLGIADSFSRIWWLIGVLIISAFAAIVITSTNNNLQRPANSSWLDRQLTGTSNALASWSWHIGLLLELGMNQADAMLAAAKCCLKNKLSESSLRWAKANNSGTPIGSQTYFLTPQYQQLNQALRLPPSAGKIAFIKEVAIHYWERSSAKGEWWIQWLVTGAIWGIGLLVGVAVFAMLIPLFTLMRGLTGGPGGGGIF